VNRRHEDEGVKKTAYCVENGARMRDASSRSAINELLTLDVHERESDVNSLPDYPGISAIRLAGEMIR
jgi:hypothetical protein